MSLVRQFSQLLRPAMKGPLNAPSECCRRQAHSYSRQDRGLYNGTVKQFGNSISDSHRKTARTWSPNVHTHTTFSRTLQRSLTLKMPASVWRTINNDRYGGSIDAFLTSDSKAIVRGLGTRGTYLRQEILDVRLKRARKLSAPKRNAKQKVESTLAEVPVVSEATREAAKMEGVASGM